MVIETYIEKDQIQKQETQGLRDLDPNENTKKKQQNHSKELHLLFPKDILDCHDYLFMCIEHQNICSLTSTVTINKKVFRSFEGKKNFLWLL